MTDGGTDDDDVTIWAGRLRAWPTPPADVPGRSDEGDGVDDGTVLSARRATPAPLPERDTGDEPDDTTARGSRRLSVAGLEPDDGTALAQRRRSTEPLVSGPADTPAAVHEHTLARTRRASTRSAPISSEWNEGRQARIPAPDEREIYRPRAGAPEHAVRAAPTIRPAQTPVDGAAASAARRRRARRRFIVAVIVGAVLVALAIVAVVAVLILPA